jgi:hypothetical protein
MCDILQLSLIITHYRKAPENDHEGWHLMVMVDQMASSPSIQGDAFRYWKLLAHAGA